MGRNVSGKVVQILMLPLPLASSIAFPQTNQIDAVKGTGVEILSGLPPDQMAVFTGKVLPAIISQTKKAWYPIIPREAQPPQLEKGRGRNRVRALFRREDSQNGSELTKRKNRPGPRGLGRSHWRATICPVSSRIYNRNDSIAVLLFLQSQAR